MSSIEKALANIRADVATSIRRVDEGAVQWMRDMRQGHPRAASYDGSGGGVVDSMAEGVAVRGGRDSAAEDLTWLLRTVVQIEALTYAVRLKLDAYAPYRRPGEDHSVWCRNHLDRLGEKRHIGTGRGGLCRACYDFQRRRGGELPDAEQLRWFEGHGTWRSRIDPRSTRGA